MITANEIRIGIWIADRGLKEWQIDHWQGINKVASKPHTTMCMGVMTETHPLTEYVDYLKPISITKEWLLKLGFKLCPSGNTHYLSIPELKSEIHFEDFRGGLVCVVYSSTGSFIPNDIKYVHQLQNLYYSITHKELHS